MPTKFSRFCSGVIEAAWLAAVIVIPVFFNIYSSRIFEPDKITILRSLALLTLSAWFLKLLEEGSLKWNQQLQSGSLIKYLLKFPLIAPVAGLVIVYTLATIFSVTPLISFFGSYQRLQGAYTTFSYLVIFLSIIANLRSRNQVERVITTVILASLPVSLYGLLQKYNIDPIPWGGNVSFRIASNMGNSIFVAAYLIMVFPLTVGRIVQSFREILTQDTSSNTSASTTASKQIIKAAFYVFIAAIELVAIYLSGSRGPMLGLMAGTYLLLLLLSLYWKKRLLTLIIVGLAVFGAGFLTVFNMNNGPLEELKKSPAIGRFGLLLDSESNSALVRQFIWEGTVDLVSPHEPIKFPDGSGDKFNIIRPLIGYGPESMYVAYNQFYIPNLGQVEKRNASPDRSHNETWDSLVITGLAGLLIYLSIFSTIFYYGLKWQGLINKTKDKYFFFACLITGGLVGATVLSILRGIEFIGVGLPFGMIIGVVLYLTIYALFTSSGTFENNVNNPHRLIMIVLFAAIVGHFVEINFGIAIVATRTLFWVYSGLFIVIGYVLPKINVKTDIKRSSVDGEVVITQSSSKNKGKRTILKHQRKSTRTSRPLLGEKPYWVRYSLIGALIVGMLMATLGYDYVTNSDQSTSVLQIMANSFTRLPNKDYAFSPGILALILTTWVAASMLIASEYEVSNDDYIWWKSVAIILIGSLLIGILFWFFHAISLGALASTTPSDQNDVILKVNAIGSLLTKYYVYIFLIIMLAALFLPDDWPQRRNSISSLNLVIAPIVLIVLFVLINISNLKVIHADITFKMAEPFAKSGQWQVTTFLYKRALELAPREDHYYLFLGRSYLEQAKITETTEEQDSLILNAEEDLKLARSINPLNTDHTANLARLYSWWAGRSTTLQRAERAQKASDYYATAVTLSPNNSTLWDEWAVLYLQVMGQVDQAYQRLNHALSLDDRYSFTLGLLGDYYMRVASATNNSVEKVDALESAAKYYRDAADSAKRTDVTSKASYLVSLGNVYITLAGLDPQNTNRNQIEQAIDILIESIDSGLPESEHWKVQEAIAKLYMQIGEKSLADYYASQALTSAPSSVSSRIQSLITQIQSMP